MLASRIVPAQRRNIALIRKTPMSALLRHGVVRRLGGSMVQRAQAAVAEERRRLGPRLMHTDELVRKEAMLESQQKKEELYDVISLAKKEHMIQRAPAVSMEEPRRLGYNDKHVRKEVMLKIQQKKEELYDVISKAEENKITNRWNRKLLQNLSVQIAPRPYDRKWYWLRIADRLSSCVDIAGIVWLATCISIVRLLYQTSLGAEKEKVPQPVLASTSGADNLV